MESMVASSHKPVSSVVSRFTILADDLTGACDAAVPFAERGLRTLVLIGKPKRDAFDAQVVALSTETRDVTPETIPEQLGQFLALLPQDGVGRILFKKIDSVLRGNTFAEIAILSRMLSSRIFAVAPAFPALDRRMKNGVQRIGNRVAKQSVDVDQELRRAGVATRRFDSEASHVEMGSVAAAVKAGSRVLLFDAETQSNLESVVRALSSMKSEVFWVGSGGLAHALASVFLETAPRDLESRHRGKLIFFVGSDHPATQSQLRQLHADHGMVECIPTEGCPHAEIVVCRVQRGAALKHTTAFFSDVDPAGIGCIFVTGGDTAMHLCLALDITAITIQREFARGVPVGIIRGGRLDGVSILTKSGGFGDGDLLSRVAAAYSKEAKVAQ